MVVYRTLYHLFSSLLFSCLLLHRHLLLLPQSMMYMNENSAPLVMTIPQFKPTHSATYPSTHSLTSPVTHGGRRLVFTQFLAMLAMFCGQHFLGPPLRGKHPSCSQTPHLSTQHTVSLPYFTHSPSSGSTTSTAAAGDIEELGVCCCVTSSLADGVDDVSRSTDTEADAGAVEVAVNDTSTGVGVAVVVLVPVVVVDAVADRDTDDDAKAFAVAPSGII